MRIVVTGREGQVVRSLVERGPALGHEVVPVGRPQLDLAGDPSSLIEGIRLLSPDVVVSAAAYTAVDKAESEPGLAFAINERGAAAVARAAASVGAPLIHLSTDYVFDGNKLDPYIETDPTGPTGIYGASKLAGETAVIDNYSNTAILRTAWVFSPFGSNFVKTMLRIASDRDAIPVVADQLGNPTSAHDIADGVLHVARNLVSSKDEGLRGIFHMTASGDATWADFAEAIFAASRKSGGASAEVRRISTADYPTPAKRPANSRLNSSKLHDGHGVRLPDWRNALNEVVTRLSVETLQEEVSQR